MNLFRKKSKPDERRAQHRQAIPMDAFEATLRNKEGRGFLVAVVELSAGGSTVRTSGALADEFSADDSVVLDLVVSNPGRMIHIQAQVRRVDDKGVHLEFLEPNLDEISLDAESRMLLSRRKHPRLRLSEHTTVELTIASVVVTGTLVDVSESGAGLTLPDDLAGRLTAGDEVEVVFTLPNAMAPCAVSAVVRHRTPRAGKLLFGLEFTPERKDQLNSIVEFMAGQRR